MGIIKTQTIHETRICLNREMKREKGEDLPRLRSIDRNLLLRAVSDYVFGFWGLVGVFLSL